MDGARVIRIRLNYGNQRDRTHEIPQGDRPVVIAGPNGSGKTTLLEAIVRTLFGFNRRSESDLLEARLETLESGWCELRVRTPEGTHLDIRRSFDDARAVITTVEGQEERFKGDANPAGTNEQSRRFRDEVRTLMGMADYEDFSKTAFVEQGTLVGYELTEELLRVASGGTGGVDEALSVIEKRYFELTRGALPGQSRGKNKNRELENLRDRHRDLTEELGATAAQERKRGPMAAEIRTLKTAITELRTRIKTLERAQGAVQSRRGRQAEEKLAEKRTGDAQRTRERLLEARKIADGARKTFAAHGTECPPAQVEAEGRALRGALEALAEARRKQEADPGTPTVDASLPMAVWGSAVGGAIGAVLAMILGQPLFWGVAVAGVAVAFWQYRAHRQRVKAKKAGDDRRTELESAVTEARTAVTEQAGALGLGGADPERIGPTIEKIEKDAAALVDAEGRLAEKEGDAAELRRELRDGMEADESEAGSSEDLLEALRACEEHFRQARVRLALEEEETDVDLPEGVEATPDAVTKALSAAREELTAAERERDRLREELLTAATSHTTSVALKDELRQLTEEIERVEARVRSLGLARELLLEAYGEFREGDEQRLLDRISDRATALSGGQIGPIEAGDTLEDARITVLGRLTPLDSRALSYGERVAIGLALRLGATDFLARNGIRPPLIIDEPFDDLDPERARGVWELLKEIAGDRQVILTSQNPLTLDHLGITPAVRLTERGLGR